MPIPDQWNIDPDNCTQAELNEAWMSLSHARKYVVEIMGFSDQDLHAGLMAGVIKSTGQPDERGGFSKVEVQIDGLIQWVALLQAKKRRN